MFSDDKSLVWQEAQKGPLGTGRLKFGNALFAINLALLGSVTMLRTISPFTMIDAAPRFLLGHSNN